MSKFNMQDAIVQSITDTLNEHNIATRNLRLRCGSCKYLFLIPTNRI